MSDFISRKNIHHIFVLLGDDATNEQSYRYLTIDEMKSLGDDSLPLDITREDRYDTTAGYISFWKIFVNFYVTLNLFY